MKAEISLKTVAMCILCCLSMGSIMPCLSQDLVINEVLSSNGNVISDEDGDFSDWIEIFNHGGQSINLNGYYLSDSESTPLKWEFPNVSIPSQGFLLIWASGKDRKTGQLHTNFSISQSGEPILLSDNDGNLLDKIEARFIDRDHSFGRTPDGEETFVVFSSPTPGRTNNEHEGELISESAITFSRAPGFYNRNISLSLDIEDPSYKIYYTTDGSEPDQSSNLYQAPILLEDRSGGPNRLSMIRETTINGTRPPDQAINKSNIIRAKGFSSSGYQTKTFSGTYFIDGAQEMDYSIPVISIKLPEEDLFDYHRGIYVTGKVFDDWKIRNPSSPGDGGSPANYNMRGQEWQRNAHIEFFDQKQLIFQTDFGLRTHGGWSRAHAIKSLRIYLPDPLHYNIFQRETNFFKDGNPIQQFILRPSGNDFYSTLFRDAFMHQLAESGGLITQNFRPSIVFLNGEYWGIHNIRERIDADYIEANFNVNEDEIDMLSINGEVDEGANTHYWQMINFIRANDLSVPENYDHLNTMMDIEQFLRYFATQIYFNNQDWPHNNIQYWRKRTGSFIPDAPYGHDGRWRWILYDTDFGFGLYNDLGSYSHNTLEWATRRNTHYGDWPNLIFINLLKNETFKINLINFFADCLNTNLKPENIDATITAFRNLYAPEIEDHRKRWGFPWDWNGEVNRLVEFGNNRPGHLKSHIQSMFELTGQSTITIQSSIEQQDFEINTLNLRVSEWSGDYFHEIPVRVKALSRPGYRFVEWEGSGITDPEVSFIVTKDTTLIAKYEDLINWPEPFSVKDTIYHFASWSSASEAETYPPHMTFMQTTAQDPDIKTEFEGNWVLPYDLTSRSRISGLGNQGISFVNTANAQDTDEAGYLGAAVLALNTEEVYDNLVVNFTAGTIAPNFRTYGLRFQYKIKKEDDYIDVLGADGTPVVYLRNEMTGHEQHFHNIPLPQDAHNQKEVYLRWKYYYVDTGASGARAELRLDNIKVYQHTFPEVHHLLCEDYHFSSWDANADPGTYPDKMILYQVTDIGDPQLEDEVDVAYTLSYNLENRSRINGLGENGLSFVNTGNPQEANMAGYMGAATISLNTRLLDQIKVNFTAGTINSNEREYRLILQYRIGKSGQFKNVHHNEGPVEYIRNTSGHEQRFENIVLPAETSNKDEIQLRWKYYYVDNGASGARAELRLDDIFISGQPILQTPVTTKVCFETSLNEILDLGDLDATVEWFYQGEKIPGNNPLAMETGVYYLQLIDQEGCHWQSPEMNIQVLNIPQPVIEVTAREEDYILVSSFPNGNQWYWNGIALVDETAQVLTTNKAGDYSVQVTLNDCLSDISEPVEIDPLGDKDDDEEEQDNILKVFPNPFHNTVYVEIPPGFSSHLLISILDSHGKRLFRQEVWKNKNNRNEIRINTKSFPRGIYLLHIESKEKVLTRKLIKM